jgi:hypothetical protein
MISSLSPQTQQEKPTTESTEEGQMTSSQAINGLDALASAWRKFQTRAPIKLHTVRNVRHYCAMIGLVNKLVDEVGDRKTHSLAGLLDVATFFARNYEERNIEIPGTEPMAAPDKT